MNFYSSLYDTALTAVDLCHIETVSYRDCVIQRLCHKETVSYRDCVIKRLCHLETVSYRYSKVAFRNVAVSYRDALDLRYSIESVS